MLKNTMDTAANPLIFNNIMYYLMKECQKYFTGFNQVNFKF